MMSLLPARLNRDIRWHGCTVIDWFGIIEQCRWTGDGGWNAPSPVYFPSSQYLAKRDAPLRTIGLIDVWVIGFD